MTRRLVSSTIMLLLLCGSVSVFAQSKISPLSDYMYKKDLEKYETIKKEADPQKRAAAWLAFLKERPINRVLLYVVQDYQTTIDPYIQKKDWTKATSMAETMLSAIPTDQAIKAAEIPVGVEEFTKQQLLPSRLAMQNVLVVAYYGASNWAKAAELQEKVCAIDGNVKNLQSLGNIYLKIPNYDKYLANAKKILAQHPANTEIGLATLAQAVKTTIDNKSDVATAIDLFNQNSGKLDARNRTMFIMELFAPVVAKNGDNVPAGVDAAKWKPIQTVVLQQQALAPYAKKDFAGAMPLFEKVVKADPKNADAWYYIGMCKWQTKDQKGAIEPFAKSVVLNKANARQYLEQLYKAENKNTLDGLDAVLAKAKTDLGL